MSNEHFYTVAVTNGDDTGVHTFPTLVQADHFVRQTWRVYMSAPIPPALDEMIRRLSYKGINVAVDRHPLSSVVVPA